FDPTSETTELSAHEPEHVEADGDDLSIDVEFEGAEVPPETWRPSTGTMKVDGSRIVKAHAVAPSTPRSTGARATDTEPPPTLEDHVEVPMFPGDVPAQGKTCGRYRLRSEIAMGGMATLFLARQDGPGGFEKIVALKRIHESLLDDEQFIEMFLDEARIASRITHPNVCSVLDFGEADGNYFLAMEYLLGQPLSAIRRRLAADPLLAARSFGPLLRIVADAAEGLHAAHELTSEDGEPMNVVHRDIAPPNLFVTFDGNTKVLDFGIAKAAGRIHKTSTGVLKGHLPYMSPEQFTGAPIDRRSDVWALGVVLWELVTGQRLFDGSDFQVLKNVTGGEIPTPSSRAAGISPAVDSLVMKALSRDPSGRHATAREFGRDVNRILARLPDPIGVAEVGEWLTSLFSLEKERQLEDLREARRA
ncbi:MAG: serine/threonine-protein kinase, partial [Polyangiaceae bacterium]